MGKVSVEQKLTMLNQLRSQYDKNQSDLMRREQILYGRTSVNLSGEGDERWAVADPDTASPVPVRGSFRLRLLAAVILAVLMILYDRNDKEILGVSTSQIYTMISNDYMTQFAEKLE